MRLKVKPFDDPLSTTPHQFSEIFEDGRVPEHDFTIVVRRSGHGVIRRETLSRIRSGELKTKALQAIAEKYSDGEIDIDKMTDEQMVELAQMDEANSWVAPLLIEDILDLPVDEDGEVKRVNLSDEPESFAETIDWLFTEFSELPTHINVWAQAAEKRYQDYVTEAKKALGSTSTPRQEDQPKSKLSGSEPVSASTSN